MKGKAKRILVVIVKWRHHANAYLLTGRKQDIHHLHISPNAPYLPPKVLHNLCCSFLLGITAIPREIENKAYAKFWGANKVRYGSCASGEYTDKKKILHTWRTKTNFTISFVWA